MEVAPVEPPVLADAFLVVVLLPPRHAASLSSSPRLALSGGLRAGAQQWRLLLLQGASQGQARVGEAAGAGFYSHLTGSRELSSSRGLAWPGLPRLSWWQKG